MTGTFFSSYFFSQSASDSTTTRTTIEGGGIWAEGVVALRKVFGQTTIAEVARREAEEAGSGMYFI